MQTKKNISLLLVAVLICIAVVVPASAEEPALLAGAPVTLGAESSPMVLVEEASASSAKAGDTVKISVVAGNAVPAVYIAEFAVNYDAALFTLESAAFCDAWVQNDGIVTSLKAKEASMNFRMLADTPAVPSVDIEKDFVLATVTLKALADVDKISEKVVSVVAKDTASKTLGSFKPTVKNILDALYGDVNGDGKVDLYDLVRLQKYISDSTTTIVAANADVKFDSKVDLYDLVRLQKYISDSSSVVLGPEA